ncbi:peptidoglycan-binding protein [Nocardiopsis sp. CNT-189]|uniref:peptidoglycan-binding protein n=1 Tax=Nocardiopsis oceanisediminis TaxID=2816862 RepID=UPI003B2B928A
MRRIRRPGRRAAAALACAAVLAAGGGAALVAWGGPEEERDGAAGTGASEEVRRTDLSEHTALDGELGYRGSGEVLAGGEGVLTRLPKKGAVVGPGEVLYEVDDRPVVLLRGDAPAYRPLEPGAEGEDVHRFERALAELGYTGFTPDEEYTALTAEAVKRWQRDTGARPTGEVDPAGVWFAPGELRVSGHPGKKGQRLAGSEPVLETTTTEQVVRTEVEAADRGLVEEDDEVEVVLPSGERVAGRITSVGTVAEERDDGQGGKSDPVLSVSVEPEESATAAFFDRAPVEVEVRTDTREDVLAVPVGALISLPGGGYGVSVLGSGGRVADVEVETGLFADGLVEIEGDVEEGQRVVVPT